MALAVSRDPSAAHRIHRPDVAVQLKVPASPVWLTLPAAALQSSDLIPERARPFASALRDAEHIVFTLDANGKDLALTSYIKCRSDAAASVLEAQLEEAVSAIRGAEARRDDLAAVLRAGTFYRQDQRVIGQWPVPHEFIEAITTGNVN